MMKATVHCMDQQAVFPEKSFRKSGFVSEHYRSVTRKSGVADGDRTRDNRNHNPGLYQLSYGHHIEADITADILYYLPAAPI